MGGEFRAGPSGVVDPAVEPNRVLWFEPPEAQVLDWLPLAVRYKLDRGGLRLGLEAWRAIGIEARRDLVACGEGEAFGALVRSLAVAQVRETPAVNASCCFADYLQSKMTKTRLPKPEQAVPAEASVHESAK